MKSMTGYGKSTVALDGRELTVEVKSVNHRFLDISTKISRAFAPYEDIIRSLLSENVSRGHVEVYVNYKLVGDSDKVVNVDLALAKGYVDSAEKLAQSFPQLKNDFSLNSLMKSPDVLTVEQQDEDDEVIKSMLVTALKGALDNLNAMREVEGNKLHDDLLVKISNVENLLNQVKVYAPQVVLQYTEKLRNRIADMTNRLNGIAVDEARLASEVCIYTDKSCVDEEITRLGSHIAHAREILASKEPVGRKLDFLIQEFNRETNTICSKSGSMEMTNVALEMKNEIEKIREQVQNLE